MNLLFIGDIVGRPGRDLVRQGLRGARRAPRDRSRRSPTPRTAAAGFGITREIGDELLDRGVDVMTSGNHIWDKKEALDYIGAEPRLLRPANFPPARPAAAATSRGRATGAAVGVINVMGRVFMAPHRRSVRGGAAGDRRAAAARRASSSSTSTPRPRREKIAMGWHLDGTVTAVVGTHTHVQTADERILPERHGLPHRRRHDRPARRHHRRRARGRRSPASSPACRRGSRPPPAIPG